MTVRVVVSCDGGRHDRPSMALESCRGFLPLGSMASDGTVIGARSLAAMRGWSRDGVRDLCPDCTRARAT